MARSFNFQNDNETTNLMKSSCNDPLCDTKLWKVIQELDLAKLKIRQLQNEILEQKNKTFDTRNVQSNEQMGQSKNDQKLHKTISQFSEFETVL